MNKVTIIGIDLAKRLFQAHGAASDGEVVFRKKLSRSASVPRRTASMHRGDGGLRDGP
jgi:transposase